jgi:hypothetical protein
VCVTHVESVSRIWVVEEESSQAALNDLMSELAAIKDSLQPVTPGELKNGEIYAAKYSLDGDLYRVKIIESDSSTAEVVYLDYGNSEEVELKDVYQLPASLTGCAALARPVTIRGAQFALDSEEGRERLKSHLTEGSVCITGGGGGGGDCGLMVDGKPLNLQYLLKCKVGCYRYRILNFLQFTGTASCA